jgi:hypothetical protein
MTALHPSSLSALLWLSLTENVQAHISTAEAQWYD